MGREILNRNLINKLSELNEYDYPSKFKVQKLKEYFCKYYERLEIDFDNLTKEEAFSLGFKVWKNDIMLIPLYLKPKLPIGIELIDIFDNIIKYDGSNIDNDIRFGCLAYGIRVDNSEGNNKMIKKINCTACGMEVKLGEGYVVCQNCKKEFDTNVFNLNVEEGKPLAVFSFENNNK